MDGLDWSLLGNLVLSEKLPVLIGEDVIDVGDCGWAGGNREGARLCSLFRAPPARVKSSIAELGTGFFVEIDKNTGNYVYEMENGELYEF